MTTCKIRKTTITTTSNSINRLKQHEDRKIERKAKGKRR